MKSYHIHLETFLSDDYLDILNSYWEIKDNEFVNKPKQLAEKNNITLAELNSLVKEYSHCKISFADCVDCKNEISTLVYSQTSFIEKRRKKCKDRCKECEVNFFKEREAEKLRHFREEKFSIEKKFEVAISEKKWNELSADEFEVLKQIIRIKNKSQIFKEVFGGNPINNRSIWDKVNKIQKLGLISIERYENNSIKEFSFHDDLDKHLNDIEVQQTDLDCLSLALFNNKNKISARHPEYTGTFTLTRSVKMEANVKYIYGGWLNSDGSINLRIQPYGNITQYVTQNELEKEDIELKDDFLDDEQVNF